MPPSSAKTKRLVEMVLASHGADLDTFVTDRRANDEPWDRIAEALGAYGVDVSRWTLARWFPEDEADVA
jgi:hypothetical protein